MKVRLRRHNKAGFTLLEMSIVLAITSFVVVGVVVIFTASLSKRQIEETQFKMKVIEQALYDFRVAFNRLPCPADVTMTITDAKFGIEAANAGTCTGGSPAANFSNVAGTPVDARQGMVPVQTLRLPDDYAVDGWGRRIMYAVSKDMTQYGAFTIVTGVDTTPRMTVKNEKGVASSTIAAYVLVSFGYNGHGAYPRSGGTTRLNFGSINVDELQNCDCTSAAVANGLNGIFVQKAETIDITNALNGFDDIVSFGTRADMVLKSSLSWSPVTGGGIGNGLGAITCPGNNYNCSRIGEINTCTCNQ